MEGLAVIDLAFWRGRRVLLTGHTGFKGSWLALWLQSLGAQVTGYALPPQTRPNLFQEARVGDSMQSIEGDVRDLAALTRAVQVSRPEVVFHLAAQSLVRRSYRDPLETYATNVMGTVHLLEAVRATSGIRAVVNVTSDKCYENREWTWGYREIEPLGGADPYSSSKACAELVTAAYRQSFFGDAASSPALATARAGNVIGGGDWAEDRLVPDVLSAFLAGRPATLRRPQAVRPWQHVLEPLGGYLLLAQRLLARDAGAAGAWNFGPDGGDAQPVQVVVERLARLWGEGAGWQPQPGDHPHEASLLMLDISKARHQLGWRPRLPLDAALSWVVDWARAHRDGADARALTLQQIQAYQVLVMRPSQDAE